MSICIIYIVALKNRAGEWLPDPTSAIATRKINGRHAIFGKKDSPLPHPHTHTQNAQKRPSKQTKQNEQTKSKTKNISTRTSNLHKTPRHAQITNKSHALLFHAKSIVQITFLLFLVRLKTISSGNTLGNSPIYAPQS